MRGLPIPVVLVQKIRGHAINAMQTTISKEWGFILQGISMFCMFVSSVCASRVQDFFVS